MVEWTCELPANVAALLLTSPAPNLHTDTVCANGYPSSNQEVAKEFHTYSQSRVVPAEMRKEKNKGWNQFSALDLPKKVL